MYQLTYISTARPDLSDADIEAILVSSCRRNSRNGVTGILLHDGKRFLQALEGEQNAVDETYQRIKADSRHRATVQLSLRTIEKREFGDWEMASHRSSQVTMGRSISEDVDALVADVTDANTRALFSGFARIRAPL